MKAREELKGSSDDISIDDTRHPCQGIRNRHVRVLTVVFISEKNRKLFRQLAVE